MVLLDVVLGYGAHPDPAGELAPLVERALAERGLRFLGTGVSGGEEGALHGPSIMPGGSPEAYGLVEQLLTTIAAQVDGVHHVHRQGGRVTFEVDEAEAAARSMNSS